jgi:hypothetical protein
MKRVVSQTSSVVFLAVALMAGVTTAGAQTFTVSPTSLAFGNQVVNSTSVARTITLTNGAGGALTFSVTANGPYTSTDACNGSVAASGTCVISVRFVPTALGSSPGSIVISDTTSGSNTRTVPLTGSGVLATTLSVTSLALGDVVQGGTSKVKKFKLTNNQDVQLTTITITSSNPAFTVTGCSSNLGARKTCTASVTFKPTSPPVTVENATLTITHSAVTSPQIVLATGASVFPISVTPGALTFQSTVQGFTRVLSTLKVKNNLGSPLTGITLTPEGPFTAAGCTTNLGSGKTCSVTVTFAPTSHLGTVHGAVTVASNNPGAWNRPRVPLTGTATPQVVVTPNPYNFSNTTVAATSNAKSFTIKNLRPSGSITFSTPKFSFGGASPSDFNQTTTTCGATLAAGATCAASVTFKPTQGGVRSALLQVNSSATGSPHTTQVTGTGTTPMTVSPSSHAFGNVAVGLESAERVVTLQNNQSIPVTFTSVTVSGDFEQKSITCAATLAANSSCTRTLVMKPTLGGARTGSLVINSDTTESPKVVPLSGTGTNAVTATPTTLAFGGQKVGTPSLSKQITLTNHQVVPAALNMVVIGDYAGTSTCGGTIPALSTCVASIVFTPAATGARSGTATFNNPGGAAVSVSLTGTGNTADPPAAVSNVSPGAGQRGTTVVGVVISGNGYSHFSTSSVVTVSGGDVTVQNRRNESANSVTVDLVIGAGATPGGRSVTVTTGGEVATLASAFVVTAGAAAGLSVAPQVGSQGETLNVAIVGEGTAFTAGVTMANFGEGVFVNGAVTVTDATHASVNVSVSPTATLGWRTVTLVTGGEFATAAPSGGGGPGFLVTASDAALASIAPASSPQGQGPFVVTVIGANTHFQQGATQLSLGNGINVGSITVSSPTQLQASIVVTAGAAPGLRTPTVTTGGEVVSLANGFTVTPSESAPYLSSVSPTSAAQGDTVNISIVGVNTQFLSGSPTLNLGDNVAINALTVIDNTHVSANMTVSLLAAVGGRNATLSSNGTDFSFTFVVLPSTASIVDVSPSSGPRNTVMTVAVTGENTHWSQNTTAAYFPYQGECTHPAVSAITVLSPTSAELLLTIPASACTGALTFEMATGGEVVNAIFSVFTNTPSMALSPSSALAGTTVEVNVIGEFSHFTSAAIGPTTANIDGASVAIQNFTVLSPTSATATFVIDAGALTGGCHPPAQSGCHTVTLTTPLAGGGNEILTAPFNVTSAPAVLTRIEPFHAAPGTTTLVRIFGSHTHFAANVTTLSFGPNTSVANLAIVSPTELTANVTIGSTAALGYRPAFVNTGSEQLTIGFRVDGPASPSIVAATPSNGRQGESLTVQITGVNTHFNANSELILGEGVTVTQFAVEGPTSATAIVDISTTAPVGQNSMVVITPLGAGSDEVVSGLGFSVERGAQTILFVKGASEPDPPVPPPAVPVSQNQVINVAIVGQGTHWLQGGTTADFGPGVVVNQLTIANATHATAQITVLSSATPGFHMVGLTTGGEFASIAQGLNVQDSTPTLLSSTPNAGPQGTTFNVQVLARHTHWQQGVTSASYGSGITVNSFTVVDSVSGIANVTVDPLAFTGACHALVVTTGTEQVSLPTQVCVSSGPAIVTGVSPSMADQGSTLQVTVTGQSTHFTDALTTADFGPGINVTAVDATSPTTAVVSLAVTSGAANGFRTVTMRTLGETAAMPFAFVVGGDEPSLVGASPTSAQQTLQNVAVQLTGLHTHWTQGVTTVSFGQGITVTSVTVNSATSLTAVISVAQSATVGARTITVTTGGEIVSAGLFSVTPIGALITEVTPDSANQGQEIVLTITGQDTHWQQGLTQFGIAGAGGDIQINFVLINSPTSATAGITISPTASLGGRSVYLTTGNEVLVNQNALIVTGGIPAIASLNPGSAQQGQTGVNVLISGLYTEWLTGMTSVDFGPGLTLQNYTVNSDTSITAVVDVHVAAQLGLRTVTVRNGTQALTGSFEIVTNAPPTPSIAYMAPFTGLRGQTLTISLKGAHTHWLPGTSTIVFGDPGTSGITVNDFQVLSPTSAIANITIAGNAPFTTHTVEIETGTELVTAGFSVVQEVPVITIVDPATGMQGTVTMMVNVLGQYTAWNGSTTFDFGAGIEVLSTTVLGPTVAQVEIAIDQLAVLGSRAVTATTDGSSVGGGLFSVTPSLAVITAVSPNTARQNDTIAVEVTGQNTHWTGATTFSFGGGINVTNTNVVDATHATVTISVEPLAALGAYGITATTGGEVATMANVFVVQPGTPLVLSSAPASGQQQQNVTLTILGQFTNWTEGETTVSVGNGVNVTLTTVTGFESITAQASIDWFATPGHRTITVTTGEQVLTLPNALLVTNGPAALSSPVSPAQGNTGQTMNVAVTGVNTHFAQGSTTAQFGAGIAVNTVMVTSPTAAIVDITIAGNASAGLRSVSLSTQGETAIGVDAFTVVNVSPRIQFVSPSSRAQGTTGDVTVTGEFTNFNGSTVFDFGAGVTVNGKTINSSVSATVNITVSHIAPRTTRDVTATTGAELATGSNKFTVTSGAAFISAVSPDHGRQNQNGLQVTISGNGTHFTAAPPAVSLGAGVTTTDVQVTSDTLLVATVNISPTAPVQLNDVSVTTSGELAVKVGGFDVTSGQPIISSVTPSSAEQAETLTVQVTALYTNFVQGTTTATFGPGITINTVTVTSATQATVNVTVQQTAPLGTRAVTMTTGGEAAQMLGAFTVLAGQPQLQSVSPNTGAQGSTQNVTIAGLFTNFQAGVSQVTFSGGGVTAGAATVNGPTQLQVAVTVEPGSAANARTVTVTTGSEVVSLADAFTVLPGVPAITVINPNVAVPNSTVDVTITGAFTSFANGLSQAKFGPGIAVNGGAFGDFGPLTVQSATIATATLTIDAGATLGARDVNVQTGGEALDVNDGFTVQSTSPTAPTVTAVSPHNGATGTPTNTSITIQFSAPINRTTVSAANIRVSDNTAQVPCSQDGNTVSPGTITVDASGRLVTFAPATVLGVGRVHGVCINYGQMGTVNAIKDPSGNDVIHFTSTFTTGFAPDTAGPSFVVANVAPNDTGVGTNAPVMLGFSRAVNPITIAAGLSLTLGGTAVPGTLSYTPDYRQVTFTPTAALAPNTTYVLGYPASIEDSVGNPLVNPGSLTFTTAAGPDTTAPTVVSWNPTGGQTGTTPAIHMTLSEPINPLRFEPGYVTLTRHSTGTLVTATAHSLSADRRTITMNLARPLEPGTTYTWTMYAFDRVTSYGNVSATFTTAAGPDGTAPQVVQFSPPANAADVPVNAAIMVLFDQAIDRTAQPAITLTPAAAGTTAVASDNVTLTFTPSAHLSPSTAYTVSVTGVRDTSGNVATVPGWSFSTRASATPDTTPGTITGTPGNGEINVAPTTPVVLTLSKPVNPASVSNMSFGVHDATVAQWLDGVITISADYRTLTFTRPGGWPAGHTLAFYASYFTAMFDWANVPFNSLGHTFFIAPAAAETTPPAVVSVTPFDGATGIGPNNPITVTFSEPLRSTTLANNIALYQGTTLVTSGFSPSIDYTSVSWLGLTLQYGTTYTVVIGPDVKDLAGNSLGTQFVSNFTIAPRPVVTRPEVKLFRPGPGSGHALDAPITLMLSQPIDPATVAGALYVSQNGVLLTGDTTVSSGNRAIVFTPSAQYPLGAIIQVWLTSAAMDTAGNAVFDYQSSFSVKPNLSAVNPVIVQVDPGNGSVGVPHDTVVDVRLNKPVNPATVNASSFYMVTCNNATPVPAAISLLQNSTVMRLTPTTPLTNTECYYTYMTTAIQDVDGRTLTTGPYHFYAGPSADGVAPSVQNVAPYHGAFNIGVNATIRLTFNERVAMGTVTPQTVTLSSGGNPIAYAVTSQVWADGTNTLTLFPAPGLPESAAITVGVTAGVSDYSGLAATPFSATFNTAGAPDFTNGTVINSTVFSGDQDVPVTSVFTLTFDRPMDARTIVPTSTLYLHDLYLNVLHPVTISFNADKTQATLVPSTPLAVNRAYQVVATSFVDLMGNFVTPFSAQFTTTIHPPVGGPNVVHTVPYDGLTGAPSNFKPGIQFDRAVSRASLGGITLTSNGTLIPLTITFGTGDTVLTLHPASLLQPNANHVLTIAGVKDTGGTPMAAPVVIDFTTGAGFDLFPPLLVAQTPPDGSKLSGTNPVIRWVVNEPLDRIKGVSGLLFDQGLNRFVYGVQFVYSADLKTLTLNYPGPLAPRTTYQACPMAFFDLAGNYGGYPCTTFTTGPGTDGTPMTVTAISPTSGATSVPLNSAINVRLNKAVDPTSFTGPGVILTPAAALTRQLSPDGLLLTFTPSAPLTASTVYSIDVTGFSDFYGNAVTPSSTSFTTGLASDTVNGTANLTSPAPGSTNAPVTSTIVVTLSEPVDVARLVDDAFQVYIAPGVRLAGAITVSNGGTTLTFTPVSPLPANQTIHVYVSYFVALWDVAGMYFSGYSATFSTAPTADTTAPQILSVNPVEGAANQGLYTTVTLTFSESLDPATITHHNFALYHGYTNLNAGVNRSADNRTVTLTRHPLPPGATVSILVGTGVTDIAGNPLASAYRGTFSTLSGANASNPIVTQMRPGPGATGVALNSLITLYTSHAISQASLNGGMTVAQNGVLVSGTVTVDPDGYSMVFTPSQPFAAGAVIQVFLTDATDVDGAPFTDFSQAFTTQASLVGQPLSLSNYHPSWALTGAPTNIVMDLQFNKDVDPAYLDTTNFFMTTCSAVATPTWTVSLIQPRLVRITPTAPLTPDGCYYFNHTNAVRAMDGSSVAAAFSSYFVVGPSADTVAPTVTRIAPVNGFTNVGDNATIRFSFSEMMAEGTISPSTVALHSEATPIPFSLSFSSANNVTNVTLTPQRPLPDLSATTVSLSAGITDRAGQPIAPHVTTFTTGTGPDRTGPVIQYRNIEPHQIGPGIPPNTRTWIWRFDEPLDPAVVTSPNVAVYQSMGGAWPVRPSTLALSGDGRTVTLTLAADLVPNEPTQVWISSSMDLAGNPGQNSGLSFTTLGANDTTAPVVLGNSPVSGLTGAPVNARIEIVFDVPISPASLGQLTLKKGAIAVPFTWTLANSYTYINQGQIIRLVPSALLEPNTTYTVSLTGATDLAGNAMAGTHAYSFTTGQNQQLGGTSFVSATVDVAGVSTQLTNEQTVTNVATGTTVRLTFSHPIAIASLIDTGAQIRLVGNSSIVPAAVTMSADGKTATFDPIVPLSPGTQYSVNVNYFIAVWDHTGHQIINNACCLNFTTGAATLARERTGLANPTTVGFVSNGSPVGSPVSNDGGSGLDAWQVAGSSGGDGYNSVLTEQEKAAAYARGWRLTATIRAVSGSGFANVAFGPGRKRFDINLVKTAGGDTLVRLNTSITPLAGLEYLIAGTAYHTYELVFDPSSQTATLLVDGVVRLTGYAGHSEFNSDYGPWFGAVGGTFSHHLTRFEIMP